MPSKKSRLRLYGDENVPVPCITYLKSKGVSAVHAFDYKYIARPDKDHVQKSKILDRILISVDKDVKKFTNVVVDNHPGIILLSPTISTPEKVNQILDIVLKHVTPNFVKEAIIRVTTTMITRNKAGEVTKKIISDQS